MLEYYNLADKLETIKEWYDRYRFGDADVYCSWDVINSIRDTCVRKDIKENFYHGILLGLLSHREGWLVESNVESGNGFSDILVEICDKNIGIIIEVKYPDGGDLEAGCREALNQIIQKRYESRLHQDGMENIIHYGIACYRKQCKVCVKSE